MSYFALQEDLEKLFGRPVALVLKEGLHRVIRNQVLADAQVLYAAWGTACASTRLHFLSL